MTKSFASLVLSLSLLDQAVGFGTFSNRNNLPFQSRSVSTNDVVQPKQTSSLCFWASPELRGSSKLFMGWGPDPIWSTAKVSSNVSGSPSGQFVQVTIDVPASAIEEYKIPGQYVQLKESESEDCKPLFLAVASPPAGEDKENAENKMEFLIKRTDNNGWIADASESTEVFISQVLGGGFPMEENFEGFKYDFPCQNVLLFANGSGIAPLRAAIESSLLGATGEGGRTARLYYGVTSPADMPYADKFTEWEAKGVEVVPVVSRPEESEWNGRTGYVQNALEEDGVPIPRNTGALLCGVKGMAESVTDLLSKAGKFIYCCSCLHFNFSIVRSIIYKKYPLSHHKKSSNRLP